MAVNRRKEWTCDRFRKQWNFLHWQAHPVAGGKKFNCSARSNSVPAQEASAIEFGTYLGAI